MKTKPSDDFLLDPDSFTEKDWDRIKFLGEALLKENAYSGNHLKIAIKALFLWIDEQIEALESKPDPTYLKH